MSKLQKCADCGVGVGELHDDGCDIETCPMCGMQALSCGCDFENLGFSKIPWSGVTPASVACRSFGWYAKFVNGRWESCDKDDPNAVEDLNRLYASTTWDADTPSWRI